MNSFIFHLKQVSVRHLFNKVKPLPFWELEAKIQNLAFDLKLWWCNYILCIWVLSLSFSSCCFLFGVLILQ
jgi:hypothetical protein